MADILCIDTSGPRGVVLLSRNGVCLAKKLSDAQQQHASFLHPAIGALLQECQLQISQLDAIAVSNGPGSYTGLRIALAAAKGFCFALQKPLITISSLQLLATASEKEAVGKNLTSASERLYCPMVDARRMEVFTALYSQALKEIEAPHAAIIDEHFMSKYLETHQVIFSGSGSDKWKRVALSQNAMFVEAADTDEAFAAMAFDAFEQKQFADAAYAEPFYCKAFYTTAKVNKPGA